MLQVSKLRKSYGDRVLFDDVSFSLGTKDRVGLVGRNGHGKSTLFKIICGVEDYDEGTVSTSKRYRLGYLQQHLKFNKNTIVACAMEDMQIENPELYEYQAKSILMGLGFAEEDFQKSPNEFSGGFQLRLNLAKVILSEPDLLLLDEPTNYLDIVSIRWLTQFLQGWKGEMLLITHDRGFMDNVCTHIMGIHRQNVKKIRGDTRNYYEKVTEEEDIHEKTRVNLELKKAKAQKFVDRFKAKATMAKRVQSHMKMIDRMGSIDSLSRIEDLEFRFNYDDTKSKVLLNCSDLSFGYDPSSPLFSDLKLSLQQGDKIGIVGKNGRGKTTLLRVLLEDLKKTSGDISFSANAKLSYFGQTNVSRLHENSTIIEEIGLSNSELTPTRIRGLCGQMMFSGDEAEKQIKVLSGGEKSRVLLAKVLAQKTNLLFLDEPSNHLDMQSVESLISSMKAFPGAMLFVTHDETMLRKVANKLIVFQDGNAKMFLGGLDDFLRQVGFEEEREAEASPSPRAEAPKIDKKTNKASKEEVEGIPLNYKKFKKLRSELVREKGQVLKPYKKDEGKLEAEISIFEREKAVINEELLVASQNKKSESVQEYSIKLHQVEAKLSSFYEKLEEVMESMDKVEEDFAKRLNKLSKEC